MKVGECFTRFVGGGECGAHRFYRLPPAKNVLMSGRIVRNVTVQVPSSGLPAVRCMTSIRSVGLGDVR
jgi:hypothetical protein